MLCICVPSTVVNLCIYHVSIFFISQEQFSIQRAFLFLISWHKNMHGFSLSVLYIPQIFYSRGLIAKEKSFNTTQ